MAWKDKVGNYEVKLTQGLAVSLHAQYSWTIPSGALTEMDGSALFTAGIWSQKDSGLHHH
jgi:hypothetical protein